jgi:Tol biopolymer transport system component
MNIVLSRKWLQRSATLFFASVLLFALGFTFDQRSVTLVSSDSAHLIADGDSHHPVLSGDGHSVAFYTAASNLVPGDENGFDDTFVKNLDTEGLMRVSSDVNGIPADEPSKDPDISADGRFVVFDSTAKNLVPGVTSTVSQVFIKDTSTGEIKPASASIDRIVANAECSGAAISSDGRYVVFASLADNLVPGDTNGMLDVYRTDRETGVILRVSEGPQAQEGNADSGGDSGPAISADGRYVAFTTRATNFSEADTDDQEDIYIKDVLTGQMMLASMNAQGQKGNGNSNFPALSADGSQLVFRSQATNLSPADTDSDSDVFYRDLDQGTLMLVSADAAGQKGNQPSSDPAISADGLVVAFSSDATNLVTGILVQKRNIFVRSLSDDTILLASASEAGTPGDGDSASPSLTSDGQSVAYESLAANLTEALTGPYQIYVTTFEGFSAASGCF